MTEEVERLESLRVEVPGVDALPSVEILAGGKSVQEVPSSGRGLYNLKRATTTLKAHRSADLILPFLGRAVPVASVRPAKLASAVTYRENRLVLEDGIWIEGLSAGIYLTTAPWREPEIIPVEQDCSIPSPRIWSMPGSCTYGSPFRIRGSGRSGHAGRIPARSSSATPPAGSAGPTRRRPPSPAISPG